MRDVKSTRTDPGSSFPRRACAGAIFSGAFLLFQIQPVMGKLILPWFGGSPSVWTTCLLFFQSLLFGGYLYAHGLRARASVKMQALVHTGLVGVSLLSLPILCLLPWKPDAADWPELRIICFLGLTVGLPYFVLSAASPLLQSWLLLSPSVGSPYRFYALSNAGSLLGLVSYPFLVEPELSLGTQILAWACAFGGFAFLSGVCGAWIFRHGRGRSPREEHGPGGQGRGDEAEESPSVVRRLLWVFLPALASVLLLATTNKVCQEVAPVPLLWVVPLSLYLLSFILCFDHERWYVRGIWTAATISAAFLAAGKEALAFCGASPSYSWESSLYFGILFCACMVCHGELVRLRPHPRHLTSFYLAVAGGGALGGGLVAIAAPHVFTSFLEWELGLGAAYVAAAAAFLAELRRRGLWAPVRRCLGGTLFVGFGIMVFWLSQSEDSILRSRTFYGVVSVVEFHSHDPASHELQLRHGGVTHGRQYVDPARRLIPTTYYGEESGIGRVLRSRVGRGALHVGAVGLGIGVIAAYGEIGDFYRFYEINPEVERIARYNFTYLQDSRAKWDIVVGDARLSLERDPPRRFDILVLDAFSGDSIPVHLLTREAFGVYGKHLVSDGVLAVHISNRHLDLAPVVTALGEQYRLYPCRITSGENEAHLAYEADWILFSTTPDSWSNYPCAPLPSASPVGLWTDDFTNLFGVLKGSREAPP